MKLLIAGSRTLQVSFKEIDDALAGKEDWDPVTEVISGGAKGPDRAGENWARTRTPPIPITKFLPDWKTCGRGAGLLRNEEMAKRADKAIVFWDGASPGTKHMMGCLKKKGVEFLLISKKS